MSLIYIAPTMSSESTVGTINLLVIVSFDITIVFFIPLGALLKSQPMIWRKESLWNIYVIQRLHLSNLT